MTENDTIRQMQQDTLNFILAELKSGEPSRQLDAIQRLGTIMFSSGAIIVQLEKLALDKNAQVRAAALGALELKTSQIVTSNMSRVVKANRQIILSEIKDWEQNGLIESHRAEILQRRYDFDIRPGTPSKSVAKPQQASQPARQVQEPEPITPAKPQTVAPANAPAQPKMEAARPAPAPRPAAPRPTLIQTLLSETSIKIYLYLGALFVIASAAIWAALVEAARLPVLLVATIAFAAGAVGLKKRLPQPGFALSIVFSCLLPIDASVLAQTLNLSEQSHNVYWTMIFLVMAVIWALGTWFYESRLFSLAAFIALGLGGLRFGEIFNASTESKILFTAAANLIGLLAVRALKNWKGLKFAQPLFLSTQLVQGILLFLSLVSVLGNLINSETAQYGWIAAALTWMLAAAFYAASDILVPFLFFPWLAAASLFLVPWLFLSTFKASSPTQIIGFLVWGVLAAVGSELVHLSNRPALTKYYFPLLAMSLPLFWVAIIWGFAENAAYGFTAFLGTGITYTLVNIFRPRWYVWLTALLAGLGAYFTFFTLPFMHIADVYFGYQMLGAGLLLMVPELFFKGPLSFKRAWDWPPVVLGVILTAFNLFLVLTVLVTDVRQIGNTAVILAVYAALFLAYAFRFKQPLIGYLATTSAALSVVYSLNHFNLDLWIPALTGLAVLYYFIGFFLARNERTKPWSAMSINSGLALGAIVSIVALFTLKATGGWYALVIAALFAIEMFTRRNGYLESFVEALPSFGLILILNDFKIHQVTYYLFGASLIWLGCDLLLHLTYKNRQLQNIARVLGGILTLAAITVFAIGEVASGATAICLAVYAAFFAAYAWTYRQPRLGYLSTASAAAMVFFALGHFHVDAWLPIFTGLAAAYYLAGFFIRKESPRWAEMFRFSGLAVGSIVSLVALANLEATGGWYAAFVGGLFVLEMWISQNGWFEAGVHILFGSAAFLILRDFKVTQISYILLTLSLIWLGSDMLLERTFKARTLALPVQMIGHAVAIINALWLVMNHVPAEAALCFGIYAPFYALYAWFRKEPRIGYAAASALTLAVFFGLRAAKQEQWLLPLIALAVVYYTAGFFLRRAGKAKGWDLMLLFSGLGLGTIVALAAPTQPGGLEKAIPIAIAATFYAAEAFARKNVWLGFPANGLYLMSYFVILGELNVDEPQFFTVGAAALGLLMHYLLTRAGNKTTAFITGIVSQLVLFSATYIQMVSTRDLTYFFILFFQALVVLAYGIVVRSRSLVMAPIGFAVLAVATVLYNALKNLSLVLIIGITGLVLLLLGILAVVMRERITTLAERFSDWDA